MYQRCLRRAASIIHAGGVIAYPTETVFGLGCDPGNLDAVAEILALKLRSVRAGLIIIGDTLDRLAPWIDPTADETARLEKPSPNPTTWIVTAHRNSPDWLTGARPRIAVRVTSHPVAYALCETADSALVSTSANRRGRRPARTTLQARRWFGSEIDLVVPGESGASGRPSMIRDAATGQLLRG